MVLSVEKNWKGEVTDNLLLRLHIAHRVEGRGL